MDVALYALLAGHDLAIGSRKRCDDGEQARRDVSAEDGVVVLWFPERRFEEWTWDPNKQIVELIYSRGMVL